MRCLERILLLGTLGSNLLLSSPKAESFDPKSVFVYEEKQNKDHTLADTLGFSYLNVNLTEEKGINVSLFTDIHLNDYVTFSDYTKGDQESRAFRLPLLDSRNFSKKRYRVDLAGKNIGVLFEYPDYDYFGDEVLVCFGELDENSLVKSSRFSLNFLYIRRFIDIVRQRQEVLGYYAVFQPTIIIEGYGSFSFWSKDLIHNLAVECRKKAVLSLELGAADFLRDQTSCLLYEDMFFGETVSDEIVKKGFLSLRDIRPSAVTYLGPKQAGSVSTPFVLGKSTYQLAYTTEDNLWHLRELNSP